MITYEWDHDDLRYVERKLGDMKRYAPRALRDAVNKTAVAARLRLLRVAQERYTVKAGGFNSRAVISRASVANPTATIRVRGRTLTLPRYKFTSPKSGVKAEVLKGTGLKTVVGDRNIKAFLSKVNSGGKTKVKTSQILQRTGKERYPIKVLRGPSVPKQIEMVYDGRRITSTPLKQEIELLYRKNLDQQIARYLNK